MHWSLLRGRTIAMRSRLATRTRAQLNKIRPVAKRASAMYRRACRPPHTSTFQMIRALYDWTLRLAAHRHAEKGLAAVSFAESSFFPIPPDVMLLPMVLANRDQWWRLALICTIASVLGAVVGYAIGALAYDLIGAPILAFYGKEQAFLELAETYNSEWGLIAVLAGAVTFLPYKLFTIFSGVTGLNLPLFIAISIVGRGFRFFVVAWMVHRFGAPIQKEIEKRLTLYALVGIGLLVGGFVLVRYLA